MSGMVKTVARSVLVVIGACLAGLTINAFSPRGLSLARDYSPPPPPSPSSQEIIPIQEFLRVYRTPAVVLLDARDPALYEAGHIPGAVSLPLTLDEEQFQDCLPFLTGRTIVTYCSGARCTDSTTLADRFRERGFANVRIFHGGWEEWNGHGLPVEKGPGKSMREIL